ncbi:MAG TPA: ATP-binding protein, partial [Gemmatimonadaceae bacterium]|nr:ATP-binding protein [Gemmatimonadaceae bacterium]
ELAGDGAPGRALWSSMSDPAARDQIADAMELLRSGRAETVSWELPGDSPAGRRIFLLQIAPLREGRTVTGFVLSAIDITRVHRSREALIEIGTALSRTIDTERLFQEVSQRLRHAVPYESLAIALADESRGELRIAHHAGVGALPSLPSRGELEARARASAAGARADARELVATRAVEDGIIELTAPMMRGDDVLGAMALRTDAVDSPQRLREAEHLLVTVAAQTAAAIERAALVRREERKRRLEVIGEVTTGIAHELRNPLFGISSAAQLLRFRAREDPVVERNIGRILREVERLNGMVTDLLEYAHPRPLELACRDPDEIWDEVLEGNRGLLEQRSIVLHRTRAQPKGAPPRWMLDAERIAQLFGNVLANAVEAAPVETDLTLASSVLPSGAWRCTLHNLGAPIPADALPRVFELFFSTKRSGTGIGLALSKRIIDEHGGEIGIETGDTGTTVTILLPEGREMGARGQRAVEP